MEERLIKIEEYKQINNTDISNLNIDEILKIHSSFDFITHLKLNWLLYWFRVEDRIYIEFDSFNLIENEFIDLYNKSMLQSMVDYVDFAYVKESERRTKIANKLKGKTQPKDLVEKRRQATLTTWKNKKDNNIKTEKRFVSEKTRKLLSEKNKGKHLTDEVKEKIRSANLNKKQSLETIQKRKDSISKLKWWNNKIDKQIRSVECPEGWVAGRLPNQLNEQAKQKCSQKGKHWYNNGIKNIMSVTCPEGFVLGKLK